MATAPQVVPSASSLLFRCAQRLCALPLRTVRETMRPLPIEAVAGAPPFVLGVARVRGAATPVVDVGRLLDPAHVAVPGRFVRLELDDSRPLCLAVDQVVGIRELDPVATARHVPPLLDEATAHVAALRTLDSELFWLLDTARLVPDPEWLAGAAA